MNCIVDAVSACARVLGSNTDAQLSGGQALIALRSWHPKADVSTIVPMVEEPVTSFQPSAVITEQGVGTLWGRGEREQAELIEHVAHPDVREELREEAVVLGLLRS